jgi:hypothetical protein
MCNICTHIIHECDASDNCKCNANSFSHTNKRTNERKVIIFQKFFGRKNWNIGWRIFNPLVFHLYHNLPSVIGSFVDMIIFEETY